MKRAFHMKLVVARISQMFLIDLPADQLKTSARKT
jgi:hypothetical protein